MAHIRWRGKVSGPFSRATVLAMLRDNRISKHHEISDDGLLWRPIARTDLLDPVDSPAASEEVAITLPAEEEITESETDEESSENRTVEPYLGFENTSFNAAANVPSPPEEYQACQEQAEEQTVLHPRRLTMVLVFGLVPLSFVPIQMIFQLRFAHAAWFFSAYFCVLWAWLITGLGSWRRNVLRTGVYYGLFTTFIGISMLFIWHNIPIIASLYDGLEGKNPAVRLAGFVLGVGVFEELCKATPLLLFGLRYKLIKKTADGLFLGLMSGLGFAMKEGVDYTMQYWHAATLYGVGAVADSLNEVVNLHGGLDDVAFVEHIEALLPGIVEAHGSLVVAQLIRFISLPLLHASWAGLVGFAAAYAFLRGRWIVFAAGLAAAAVLHGLYNFFTPSLSSLIIAGVSVGLMMALITRGTRPVGIKTS
jgi:RsiW-degrading membrane proteinase PrsW (M82 family)